MCCKPKLEKCLPEEIFVVCQGDLFQCILCGVFYYEGTNVLHEAMAEKLSGLCISSQIKA